jgi:BirA family biotin operon repressor/biotin-[acetyl-CoA-carboxylase] ligase
MDQTSKRSLRTELPWRSPINSAPVYYVPEVESTMVEAAILADEGAPAGTVIQTDFQTRGRSRRSSGVWKASAGDNLLFTILLEKERAPWRLMQISLKLGLAVTVTLERLYGFDCRIKWPNDVLLDGKKICGILCQTHGSHLLAGIGINCNQRRFPPPLAEHAVSIVQVLENPVDRTALLQSVLDAIKTVLSQGDWREKIETRMAFRGERRQLSLEHDDAADTVSGTVAGLGEKGELLLRLDDGQLHAFVCGRLV